MYESEGGFIVKYLSSLETTKDLFACVRYLFSHSTAALGEPGDRSTASHAVRYFGEFSYNKFGSDAILSKCCNAVSNTLMAVGSLLKKDDRLHETKITMMEVPYRYQDAKVVYDGTHDANGTPAAVAECFRIAGFGHDVTGVPLPPDVPSGALEKDYPAQTKSTGPGHICMVCGLTRTGEDLQACVDRGHTIYDYDDTTDPPSMSPDDYLLADAALTPGSPDWVPPPRYQLHFRIRYNDNKSKLLILTLDPSMDRICEQCYNIQQVLHYVGPPNPEFFADLPDGTIMLPDAQRSDWMLWAEFVAVDPGSKYVHLGIPYFTPDGVWQVDWGAYAFPTWRLPDPLHSTVCRHVLQSKLRARCAERDERYYRHMLWDYVEHCHIATMDDKIAPTDRLTLGVPVDLLTAYKQAIAPVRVIKQTTLI